MADMTNEEFKQNLAELEKNTSLSKDDVISFLDKLGSLNGYDAESLDKLVGLIEEIGADMPKNLGDSLSSKIIEQRKVLALTQENMNKFDTMTSYDLAQEHQRLSKLRDSYIQSLNKAGVSPAVIDTPEAKEAAEKLDNILNQLKTIEEYAKQGLADTALNYDDPETGDKALLPHNAPVVMDYVAILTGADQNYKYPQEQILQAALAEYDHNNGFTGKLPTAKEIEENEDKWLQIAPANEKLLPEDYKNNASIAILAENDKETLNEVLDTLRVTALTELAAETPDKDATTAKKRYYQKYAEIAAEFMKTAEVTFAGIAKDPEQKNKWWQEYAKANNLPLDK